MRNRERAGEVGSVLQGFGGKRAWVVGDLMLDEYLAGTVSRISPEAPVPVVEVHKTFNRLGGAANVAYCMAVLGAEVRLCGVVGEDGAGDTLLEIAREATVDVGPVGGSAEHSTIRKVRVVSQRQQLLRLDWEKVQPVAAEITEPLVERLRAGERPDVIVISDYAKGFLTPQLLRTLIDEGSALGIPVLVDPKIGDLGLYRGATVATPNQRELAAIIRKPMPPVSSQAYIDLARGCMTAAGVSSLVVTLGEQGMLVVPEDGEVRAVQSASRDVYDVTGAGDTLAAVLALGLAAGADLATAAEIANCAAGVAVGKFGTAVVHLDELIRALDRGDDNKVFSNHALGYQLTLWRRQGRKIVFTNGCFDILHAGHLSLFRTAASLGDVLVVGINDDASVRRLKGEGRPLTTAAERGQLVAALDCVDMVAFFSEDTPLSLIEQVAPDVLVKGADYRIEDVVGRDLVEGMGGEVVLCPLVANRSGSRIIEKMRRGG